VGAWNTKDSAARPGAAGWSRIAPPVGVVNWRFAKDWPGRGQVLSTRNKSNIPLYTFNRVEVDPVENTVTWEGGIKIDPEVLYRDLASKAQSALH